MKSSIFNSPAFYMFSSCCWWWCFYFFTFWATSQVTRDLISQTWMKHFSPAVVAQIKHWTAKEILDQIFLFFSPNQLFLILLPHSDKRGFPGGSDGKESVYNAGDPGSNLGLGRSPGEGNGNPCQYSCLRNPMERGAWWATVHEVTKEYNMT